MFDKDRVDLVSDRWKACVPDLNTDQLEAYALVGRLRLLAQCYEDRIDSVLEQKFSLPLWGYDVLAALHRCGPPYQLTPGELSQQVSISPGAMTNRLHRLEHWGYLVRKSSAEDARNVLIELTEAGKILVRGALDRHLLTCEEMMSGFSLEDQRKLNEGLRDLMRVTSQLWNTQKMRKPREAVV